MLLAVTQETDEKALLKRANEQLTAFPRWMRVRRVVAMREPWNVDNGLLTPTLKLKRPLVVETLRRADRRRVRGTRKYRTRGTRGRGARSRSMQ